MEIWQSSNTMLGLHRLGVRVHSGVNLSSTEVIEIWQSSVRQLDARTVDWASVFILVLTSLPPLLASVPSQFTSPGLSFSRFCFPKSSQFYSSPTPP